MPNAYCPVCGAAVYFYQSPAGGRVFFDALGHPWPKHPCTDQPRATVRLRALGEVDEGNTPATEAVASSGDEPWIPIQIAAPQFDGMHRLVVCRDLIRNERLKVFIDRGFSLGVATVASMTSWTASGWTMLSIYRLDHPGAPLLLAGRREPGVGPITRSPDFQQRFQAETARLQQQQLRERSQREAQAQQSRQVELHAEARREATEILEEIEQLRTRPVSSATEQRLRALANRWRRSTKNLGAEDQGLRATFSTLSAEIESALKGFEETQAAHQSRLARRKLADEAETLADAGSWQVIGPQFRELIDGWKAASAGVEAETASQWQRIQNAFLIAREEGNREGVRAKLEVLDALARLKENSGMDTESRLSRLRVLVTRWWSCGRDTTPVAATLEGRFRNAIEEVLCTFSRDSLVAHELSLQADAKAAAARGARLNDLPVSLELSLLRDVLSAPA